MLASYRKDVLIRNHSSVRGGRETLAPLPEKARTICFSYSVVWPQKGWTRQAKLVWLSLGVDRIGCRCPLLQVMAVGGKNGLHQVPNDLCLVIHRLGTLPLSSQFLRVSPRILSSQDTFTCHKTQIHSGASIANLALSISASCSILSTFRFYPAWLYCLPVPT